MCFATDEEAKSYNECNDALRCTGCGLAVDQGFNKGGTLGAAPGVGARGVEPLPVGASSDDDCNFREGRPLAESSP